MILPPDACCDRRALLKSAGLGFGYLGLKSLHPRLKIRWNF